MVQGSRADHASAAPCETVGMSTAQERRERLAAARLYLVCDRAPGGRALAGVLAGALAGGVDLFQLRDKHASDAELLEAAVVARELCARAGALFFLNDRPDLAVAAGADGVHVGQDDEPVARARAVVGDDALVGLSTHSVAQADAGAHSGADYIAVGPVHATPTKRGRPAIGLEPVRHAAAHVDLPWFAIGGIAPVTVGAVAGAGAARIVVVRAVAEAPDPQAAAAALRAAVQRTPLPARSTVGTA
jgi:thiamine-phosphate pyrophosphorylase